MRRQGYCCFMLPLDLGFLLYFFNFFKRGEPFVVVIDPVHDSVHPESKCTLQRITDFLVLSSVLLSDKNTKYNSCCVCMCARARVVWVFMWMCGCLHACGRASWNPVRLLMAHSVCYTLEPTVNIYLPWFKSIDHPRASLGSRFRLRSAFGSIMSF